MCSKLKYFVLALFLNAAASSPYNIPRYNGDHNPEEAFYPNNNNEYDVQKRNEEARIPRSQPSYMSPVPTARDSEIHEEILRQSSNFRNPRNLNYNANDKEHSRNKEQIPSVAQSTVYYDNPSSTLNGNEVLSHLIRQNRPIVNNDVKPSSPVIDREIKNKIYDGKYNQLPLYKNIRPQVSGPVENNKFEPLKIQASPGQRIAFQQSQLTNIPNLDEYRPAIPVKKFNIDTEWSNLANKQPKLPDFIAERLRHPVDFQRSQIIGQQVHKPLNAEFPNTGQKYNIHKIISDQRIQNILSSTKQTKRYLVIHTNGTVEHVDSLAPIAAQHPNYVLVNAGHVVPAKNIMPYVSVDETNLQIPVPTLEPISSSKKTIVSALQFPEPVIRSKNVDNVQTSSPETTAFVETVPSSESSIALESLDKSSPVITSTTPLFSSKMTEPTSTTEIRQEKQSSEESLETDDDSEIESSSTLKAEAENNGTEKSDENTFHVIESSSLTPAPVNDVSKVTAAPESKEKEVTPVISERDSENDSELTRNIEKPDNKLTDDNNEFDSVGARRAGKPMVYYTSDPDFWTKVTDGEDSNFIYFFQVKSSPRVEKDRQRTIYPDGTILEELTETVWDGEGGAPKVTKSSKLIRPDDL